MLGVVIRDPIDARRRFKRLMSTFGFLTVQGVLGEQGFLWVTGMGVLVF